MSERRWADYMSRDEEARGAAGRGACNCASRPRLRVALPLNAAITQPTFSDSHPPAVEGLRFAGSRMRLLVHSKQLCRVDVRIALGRAQAGMTEQLLNGPQIGAVLQQMGGKRVPQRVRADIHARAGQS